MDKDFKVAQFISATNVEDHEIAENYLDVASWNVDLAVDNYFTDTLQDEPTHVAPSAPPAPSFPREVFPTRRSPPVEIHDEDSDVDASMVDAVMKESMKVKTRSELEEEELLAAIRESKEAAGKSATNAASSSSSFEQKSKRAAFGSSVPFPPREPSPRSSMMDEDEEMAAAVAASWGDGVAKTSASSSSTSLRPDEEEEDSLIFGSAGYRMQQGRPSSRNPVATAIDSVPTRRFPTERSTRGNTVPSVRAIEDQVLREEQDWAYKESLRADREKEETQKDVMMIEELEKRERER